MRITFDEAVRAMTRACLMMGFPADRAAACARLFAETSRDGVYTHGFERFPRMAHYVARGWVRPTAEPVLEAAFGAWERWDGRLGPGNLNALRATDRAVELARASGIGCVALRNTNHWMRGGSYGLRAADAGCAFIGWTNTTPNLPAWGSREAVLGNNPFVVCVPREAGALSRGCALLDMAMSQYSFGKLEAYRMRGEELPVDGGFDIEGRATRDASAILAAKRAMPIGFWKGSGLSLVLDLLGTLLSGGDSVGGIGKREAEYGLSQVFVVFDLARLPDGAVRGAFEEMAARIGGAEPDEAGSRASYPGQRTAATRAENEAKGIPVREKLWAEILALAGPDPV